MSCTENRRGCLFRKRLVKEKESGRPLKPTIDKMNALAQEYYVKSRPAYVLKRGWSMKLSPLQI